MTAVRLLRKFAPAVALAGVFVAGDAPSTGASAWYPVGPASAQLPALAIDPSNPAVLYTGSIGAGIFKSTDAGATWTPSTGGIPQLRNSYITSLAVDPRDSTGIYASYFIYGEAEEGGILQSTNGGISWMNPGIGLPNDFFAQIMVDLADSDTIYALGETALFCSTDRGETWQQTGQGLPSPAGFGNPLLGQSGGSFNILFLAYGGSVYRSLDDARTWAPSQVPILPGTDSPLRVVATSGKGDQIAYAADQENVFRSTDAGATWSSTAGNPLVEDDSLSTIAVDPSNPKHVIAGGSGIVFDSTDGGRSWRAAPQSSPGWTTTSLAIDPANPRTAYVGTYGAGILKTTNGGSAWNVSNVGLTNASIQAVVFDPTNSATLFVSTPGSLSRSTSGGSSWSPSGTGFFLFAPDALAVLPGGKALFAAQFSPDLARSTNGGSSWQSIRINGIEVESVAVDPAFSSLVYAGGSGGIAYSRDGGLTFQAPLTGILVDVQSLAISRSRHTTVFAAGGGNLYRSTDSGTTWSTHPVPFVGDDIFGYGESIAVDPFDPDDLLLTGGALVRSTDGGDTWQKLDFPGKQVATVVFDPVRPSTIYVGSYGAGVYFSTDSGRTWLQDNDGLTDLNVRRLSIDNFGTVLAVGTNAAGVFLRTPPFLSSQRQVSLTSPNAPSLTSAGRRP